MATAYAIHAIAEAEIDKAFPLARLATPSLDLDGWRDRCHDARRGEADEILVAVNPNGHVQGMATIRRGPRSTRLAVTSFVVASAADEAGVGLELCRYLLGTASDTGVSEIVFSLTEGGDQILRLGSSEADVEALLGKVTATGAGVQTPDRPVKT